MVLIVLALMFGAEVKGSRRWIAGVQPSEFIKPAFVVLCAWAFAEGGRSGSPALAGKAFAFLLLPATIVPLILQPDFGQTMLVSLVWAALFFMAGLHWFWVLGLGGAGAIGGLAAFKLSPHVHERVLRFIDPDSTRGMVDTFQVDTALQSILSGGWLGRGPGEGVYKRILPDAHTDFVFAVTGEEFGMIACLALIAFFGFIVVRGLSLALRNQDPFCRFAAAGLTLMFGVQSWINMAVNLRAIPAKGMTLPFISYGGSSLLALGLGMGFLVALTRKRPLADLDVKRASAP
jgi:cell division protein FtsW